MKKNYLIPNAEWILLLSQDIITDSDDLGTDIFDNENDTSSADNQQNDDVITVSDNTFSSSAN